MECAAWQYHSGIRLLIGCNGVLNCSAKDIRWWQLPSCDSTTPWSSALAAGNGTHLIQSLLTGDKGNPRPGTMVSERTVHPSFDCSQPFCSPFGCSWWFGRTQNKATTQQLAILCGWSNRLEQSTTGHLFRTYIINVQKTCSRHLFSDIPTLLTYNCFQSTSSEHYTAPLYLL